MNRVLEEIFATSVVVDGGGNKFPLHSHTPKEQCKFLDDIIKLGRPAKSLEIGLAYGISTLQIIESMAAINSRFEHIVIDPMQSEWNNIGMLNIERSGYKKSVTFFGEKSSDVLPRLVSNGTKIQFAYIDSVKLFDVLTVDLHYITQLMDNNGILVLDDCNFPGVRLLARFISRHPSYQVLGGYGPDPVTTKSRFASFVANFFMNLVPFRKRKFARFDFDSDAKLGVNYKCIAFRKTADDKRSWDWHRAF